MGLGVVSLQTSQKKEQAGPPFVATSADNGLSVDAVSGRIVLGNDVGDPAAPGAIFTNREIIMDDALFNTFTLLLNALNSLGVTTTFDGSSITLTGTAGAVPFITITTTGAGNPTLNVIGTGASTALMLNQVTGAGIARITNLAAAGGVALSTTRVGSEIFEINAGGAVGAIRFGASNISIPIYFFQVETATLNSQIGPTLRTGNGSALQVSGTLTNYIRQQGVGAGTTNIDRNIDSGKQFRNSAAANLALPNMAGANFREGFFIRVLCADVSGITVTMDAGTTLRFGSLSTSAGGTISSTDVGAHLVIVIVDSLTYVTESFIGVWTLT